MSTAPLIRWALQNIRSGAWLTENPTEPHGRGWSDSPAQAVMAIDPHLFADRIRQSLTPSLLSHCRLVRVRFCFGDNDLWGWWQVDS